MQIIIVACIETKQLSLKDCSFFNTLYIEFSFHLYEYAILYVLTQKIMREKVSETMLESPKIWEDPG